MDIDAYRDVDGVRVHSFIHENLVRSALSYKPRADEVLVVTYPKCGTTWTQYLILSILSKGHPPSTVRDFLLDVSIPRNDGCRISRKDAQARCDQDASAVPQEAIL
ncbi:hypothetical protein HPB48_010838 [Haemaphysalis longicornis]|uniref:Sulfotransferase domain-containing protein n=1 Tax=Haemaphysalis longicornis TaxID=44386 RepID=A0A9J6GA45_HAELO|nr:hypothetical protein HPB48_010838 [Haemaphysalis longicornis]